MSCCVLNSGAYSGVQSYTVYCSGKVTYGEMFIENYAICEQHSLVRLSLVL